MTYAKTNLMLLLAWTSHLTASGLRFVVKVAVFSISFLSFIQHNRKSSLMSRTTRERRRSTPVSVRFADEPALVQVIGPMEPVRRVRFKIRTGVVSLNFFALCMATVLAACTTCVFVGFVLLSCLIWMVQINWMNFVWTSFHYHSIPFERALGEAKYILAQNRAFVTSSSFHWLLTIVPKKVTMRLPRPK